MTPATPEMEETFVDAEGVRWLRWLPWLHLFKAAWMAADVRKLVLAAAGAAVWAGGLHLVGLLPFFDPAFDTAAALSATPAGQTTFLSNVSRVAETSLFAGVAGPVTRLFGGPPSGAAMATALVLILWSVLVWGVFGGAIARITALQFSDDHPTSGWGALKYSAARLAGSIGGPALPISAVVAVGALLAVAGWVSMIPGVGSLVTGVLWFLALAASLFAVLLLAGLCFGWPLMVTTIAAEGTDSFDALSRSFSYVGGRPWYAAFLLALAALVGVVGVTLVDAAAEATLRATTWFVSASGASFTPSLDAAAASEMAGGVAAERSLSAGEQIAELWQRGFAALALAYTASYFWTAATLVYFLMRRCVDATPLDRVYVPEADAGVDDLGPIVGIAATERREGEAAAAAEPAGDAAERAETGSEAEPAHAVAEGS